MGNLSENHLVYHLILVILKKLAAVSLNIMKVNPVLVVRAYCIFRSVPCSNPFDPIYNNNSQSENNKIARKDPKYGTQNDYMN